MWHRKIWDISKNVTQWCMLYVSLQTIALIETVSVVWKTDSLKTTLPRMVEAIGLELRLLEDIFIWLPVTRQPVHWIAIEDDCTRYALFLFGYKAFLLLSYVYHRTRLAGTIFNVLGMMQKNNVVLLHKNLKHLQLYLQYLESVWDYLTEV